MLRWTSVLTNGTPDDLRRLLISLDTESLARFFGNVQRLRISVHPMEFCMKRLDFDRAAVLLEFGAAIDSYPTAGADRNPLATALSSCSEYGQTQAIQFVLHEARSRSCLAALVAATFADIFRDNIGTLFQTDTPQALQLLLDAGLDTMLDPQTQLSLAVSHDALECIRFLRSRVSLDHWHELLSVVPRGRLDNGSFLMAGRVTRYILSFYDSDSIDVILPSVQRTELEQALAIALADGHARQAGRTSTAAERDALSEALRAALSACDVLTRAEVYAAAGPSPLLRAVLLGLTRAVPLLASFSSELSTALLMDASTPAMVETVLPLLDDAQLNPDAMLDALVPYFHKDHSLLSAAETPAAYGRLVAREARRLAESASVRAKFTSTLERLPSLENSVFATLDPADTLNAKRMWLDALAAADVLTAAAAATADATTDSSRTQTVEQLLKAKSSSLLTGALRRGHFALAQLYVDRGADVFAAECGTDPGLPLVPSLLFSLLDREAKRPCYYRTPRHLLPSWALPAAADARVEAAFAHTAAADLDAATERAHAAAADAEEERLLAKLLRDPSYLYRHCKGRGKLWQDWLESLLPALGARWIWDRMCERDPVRARACLSAAFDIIHESDRRRTVLEAAVDARDVRSIRFLIARGATVIHERELLQNVTTLCEEGRYEIVWAILALPPGPLLRLRSGTVFTDPVSKTVFSCARPFHWTETHSFAFDVAVDPTRRGDSRAGSLALAVTRGHRFPRGLMDELDRRGAPLPLVSAHPWLAESNAAEIPGESVRMLRWLLERERSRDPGHERTLAQERARAREDIVARAKEQAAERTREFIRTLQQSTQ